MALTAIPTTYVRAWQAGDERLIAALHLSPASLQARFLAGTPTLPASYLSYVARAPRSRWDAVVGMWGTVVVGWAEFGRYVDDGPDAELGVMVADEFQRRGIGAALAREVMARCLLSGVDTLHAEVLADNHASNGLIRSLTGGSVKPSLEGGVLHYRIPLRLAACA